MSAACPRGHKDLTPFAPGYQLCARCRVLARVPGKQPQQAQGPAPGAASPSPWAMAWAISALCRVTLPPARMLDVTPGDEGLIELARAAGFTATGPEAALASNNTYAAACLLHPEEAGPDLAETIARTAALLDDGGVLLLRLPRLPEALSLSDMLLARHPFLDILAKGVHPVLYSGQAAKGLLEDCGLTHCLALDSPEPFMLLAASRSPVVPFDLAAIAAALDAAPESRLVLALLHGLKEKAALEDTIASKQAAIANLSRAQQALARLSLSPLFRLMRRLGPWSFVDKGQTARHEETRMPSPGPKSVGVDLIPLLPGGENGGAKIVALSLIQELAKAHPECAFTLFTSDVSHDEIAWLDAANVRRECAVRTAAAARDKALPIARLAALVNRLRGVPISGQTLWRIKALFWKFWTLSNHKKGALAKYGVDVLLCPFTLPFVYDPAVPTVSIVHDLQYLYYPQFFSLTEQFERERNFRQAVTLADHIVCVSEYVRSTVLEKSQATPARVHAIHTRLASRLPAPDTAVYARLGLTPGGYLFYPANAWAHKNHRMLFTAYGMLAAERGPSTPKLVLTGALNPAMAELTAEAKAMGLGDHIVFAGFVAEAEFAALLTGCLAMVFPSLYEGFGMPVVEAMAHGKPVICSNAASLPEIAGDAAVFFDPGKPADIKAAIARVLDDAALAARLSREGPGRAALFGNAADMAGQYWDLLARARQDGPCA